MLPFPLTATQGSSITTGLQGKMPQGTDSMKTVFRETQRQEGRQKIRTWRNLKTWYVQLQLQER